MKAGNGFSERTDVLLLSDPLTMSDKAENRAGREITATVEEFYLETFSHWFYLYAIQNGLGVWIKLSHIYIYI